MRVRVPPRAPLKNQATRLRSGQASLLSFFVPDPLDPTWTQQGEKFATRAKVPGRRSRYRPDSGPTRNRADAFGNDVGDQLGDQPRRRWPGSMRFSMLRAKMAEIVSADGFLGGLRAPISGFIRFGAGLALGCQGESVVFCTSFQTGAPGLASSFL